MTRPRNSPFQRQNNLNELRARQEDRERIRAPATFTNTTVNTARISNTWPRDVGTISVSDISRDITRTLYDMESQRIVQNSDWMYDAPRQSQTRGLTPGRVYGTSIPQPARRADPLRDLKYSDIFPHRGSYLSAEAKKSKRSTDRFRKVISASMMMSRAYTGKIFSSEVEENGNFIWKVVGHPVAKVDGLTRKVFWAQLPEDLEDKTYNYIRCLWRHLGLQAIRYKTQTIVQAERAVTKLKPGQSWDIKPEYVNSIGIESFLMTEQLSLINMRMMYGNTEAYPAKTKPVNWVNYKGEIFHNGTILNATSLNLQLTQFSLNKPPWTWFDKYTNSYGSQS